MFFVSVIFLILSYFGHQRQKKKKRKDRKVDLCRMLGVLKTQGPVILGHVTNTSYLVILQYGVLF